MALRNQPYIPLYVQDFMSDEKVRECSPSAIGIYIFIMCVMHKSTPYGMILLKQKDKQDDKQIWNFANKLAKHLPFSFAQIVSGIEELINENVLSIDGDFLIQKRMVKDNDISEKRAIAGSKGAKSKKDIANKFAKAKPQANHEYEIEIVNEDNNSDLGKFENPLGVPSLSEFLTYANQTLKNDFKYYENALMLKYGAWLENGWKKTYKTKGGKEKLIAIKNWKTTLLNTIPHLKKEEINKRKNAGEILKEKYNL